MVVSALLAVSARTTWSRSSTFNEMLARPSERSRTTERAVS